MVVSTVTAATAAYALARRRIPWKGPLLLVVLFLTGIPLSIIITSDLPDVRCIGLAADCSECAIFGCYFSSFSDLDVEELL